MKRHLLTLLGVCMLCTHLLSQPTITLVGSSPSLNKGNLNADVITEIIQQKQAEVKQRVFRNTLVTYFNDNPYTEYLNNFLTYHYLYNVMDIVTSGKNRTLITKSVTESSAEFAFVYGLALYTMHEEEPNTEFSESLLSLAEVRYMDSPIRGEAERVVIQASAIHDLNILLDLCYDVALNETSPSKFNFKDKLSDEKFMTWYSRDNSYLKELRDSITQGRRDTLDTLRSHIKRRLATIRAVSDAIRTLADTAKPSPTKELLLNLDDFYTGLEKSRYKDFSITKKQYDSFRYIIDRFLEIAKNQTESDVVALVIEYLQENSIVEFQNAEGDVVLKEDKTVGNKGYLYVDIESLINSLADKFKLTGKNSGKYIQLFFTVGTNYASFTDTENRLGVNSIGGRQTLHNMYFASEKIGIRLKICNWKYTRSFGVGENYRFYNWPGTSQCWLRPQEKFLLNDVHIMVYGSGLLYNLAPLKSESEFNYAIAGAGVGITFFNGLTASVSYACPFTDNKFIGTNGFINVGMDVPIVEYITALRNKK